MTTAACNEGVRDARHRPNLNANVSRGMFRTAAIAAGIATAAVAAPVLTHAPATVYADVVSPVRSLQEFDEQIRKIGTAEQLAQKASTGALSEAEERLVLQRELVRRASAEKLEKFRGASEVNRDFLDWFMNDLTALRYYITGGEVWTNNRSGRATDADYITSLGVFARLRAAHMDDLASANSHDADVHLRMMVSCSLDVSGRARLWTGDPGFVSDHLVRYETIKTFRDCYITYRFQRSIFDALPVESMRWVFENQLTDAELPWLANYSLSLYPKLEQEDSRLNAYSYVWYTGDYYKDNGYGNAAFYDDAKFNGPVTEFKPTDGSGKPPITWQGGWKEKYRLAYEDPNFPNANPGDPFHIGCGEISKVPGATTDKTAYHRLWMVFEKGGVCGALAKTFSNLNGMVGVPSVVVGQPGHAATLTYELREDASGRPVPTYRIQNDVSGWGRTGSPSVAHWLCDWGRGMSDGFAGNYALYAQEALADWDGYVRSYESRLIAMSFEGEARQREALVDAAISAQPLNFDAYKAKIDLMTSRKAQLPEWERLAQDVARALSCYPLPMHDLIKYMEKTGGKEHLLALEAVRLDALQKATRVTMEQTVNWDACARVARNLMGEKDGVVATFSFDGEDAGKIRLGEHLRGGGVAWKYSLDGGSTWVELTNGTYEVQLTEEQLSSITAEKDILIQLIGVSTANCIDIQQGQAAQLSCEANDRANHIYFFDGKVPEGMEMRVNGGSWEPLDVKREFKGACTVEVRRPATGLTTASEPLKMTFTEGARDASFVPYEEMSVNSYSSSRDGERMADRVVDGYYGKGNEYWLTAKEPSPNAWIVLDLGRERLVSSVDYWRPKALWANGIPRWEKMTYTISAAPDSGLAQGVPVDASAFEVVGAYGKNATQVPAWEDANLTSTFTFDKPVRARYLKFHLTDIYHCAVLFDVYEVHEPGIEGDAVAFDSLTSGYGEGDCSPMPLSLVNTSKATATIKRVTVDTDAFDVVGTGNGSIAPGATDTSWQVKPRVGLAAGSYRANATIAYAGAEGQEDRELKVPVAIDVSPREVSLTVKAEKTSATSVHLSAILAGSEGLEGEIEFALCEEDRAPGAAVMVLATEDGGQVQGNPLNTWTPDPEFNNLVPGQVYYAFARVKGLPGLDAVVGDQSLEIDMTPEVPGPDQGGGGDGGDTDNGGDNGDGNGGGNGESNGNAGNGGTGGDADNGGSGNGGNGEGNGNAGNGETGGDADNGGNGNGGAGDGDQDAGQGGGSDEPDSAGPSGPAGDGAQGSMGRPPAADGSRLPAAGDTGLYGAMAGAGTALVALSAGAIARARAKRGPARRD